jgi:hypothetical protein
MVSLGVVLIHNGDVERIDTASRAIKQFTEAVGGALEVSSTEESEQDPIVSAPLPRKLLAWYLSVTGDHRWGNYLSRPKSLGERWRRLRVSIKYSKKQLKRMLRRGKRVSVARAVSAKNIRAWKEAVRENWDYLLVLEDDIVLADNASAEIAAVADVLSSTHPEDLLFASVAKALSVEDIGATELVTDRSDTLTWFSKPVSNTAAAYILSRGLAEAFVTEVTRHRVLAANPADWILNHLFMRFHRRGVKVMSFHTKGGIFVNRSILGELPSHTQV